MRHPFIPYALPIVGNPDCFTNEAGETLAFGTYEPDPLRVLVSVQDAAGRRAFGFLMGEDAEAAFLALLLARDAARRAVTLPRPHGPDPGDSA